MCSETAFSTSGTSTSCAPQPLPPAEPKDRFPQAPRRSRPRRTRSGRRPRRNNRTESLHYNATTPRNGSPLPPRILRPFSYPYPLNKPEREFPLNPACLLFTTYYVFRQVNTEGLPTCLRRPLVEPMRRRNRPTEIPFLSHGKTGCNRPPFPDYACNRQFPRLLISYCLPHLLSSL